MKIECTSCNGEGYIEEYEDDRMINAPCYHCGTTGKIDHETYFYDQLEGVASFLAYNKIVDLSNSEDYDFNLAAAENMMSTNDYFISLVYDYTYSIMQDLVEKDRETQEVLIAWHKYSQENIFVSKSEIKEPIKETKIIINNNFEPLPYGEDIPF